MTIQEIAELQNAFNAKLLAVIREFEEANPGAEVCKIELFRVDVSTFMETRTLLDKVNTETIWRDADAEIISR